MLESDLIWDSPHVLAQSIMIVIADNIKAAGGEYVPVLVGGQALVFKEVELELITETT